MRFGVFSLRQVGAFLMLVQFTEKDIKRLSQVLGCLGKKSGNNYRFEIENKEQRRKLALEIYPLINIGKKKGALISVYTPTSHLQLHFCTGYVASEMLEEVTFVGESNGKLSGLTVEREGGCSLYANVDRDILSGEFTKLGPEVMLSGIALSLTEAVLPEKSGTRSRKASSSSRHRISRQRT